MVWMEDNICIYRYGEFLHTSAVLVGTIHVIQGIYINWREPAFSSVVCKQKVCLTTKRRMVKEMQVVGGPSTRPLTAITKGQHWHNSKWEQFIVVHGHGLIQERNINTGELVEFEVTGDKIEAIYMIRAGRIRFLRKCDFHGHLQENMDGIMRR